MSPPDDDTQSFADRSGAMFAGMPNMPTPPPPDYTQPQAPDSVPFAGAPFSAGGAQPDQEGGGVSQQGGGDQDFHDYLNDSELKALQQVGNRLQGDQRSTTKSFLESMDKDRQDLASTPQPQLGKTPDAPKQQIGQGMMEFMQVATVLGAIAGGLARGNATTALNAFGAAIKGFSQGNEQEFKANLETWRASAEKMKADNQAKLDQYDLIFKNKEMNIRQKMEEFKIISAQYSDEITHNLADQNRYVQLAQMNEREKYQQQMLGVRIKQLDTSAQRAEESLQQMQDRRSAGEDIGKQIISGQMPPDQLGKYATDTYTRKYLAKSGFNLSQAQLQWAAAKKDVQSLNGPQMTRFIGLTRSVMPLIKDIRADAEVLQQSGVQLLNKAALESLIQLDANSDQAQVAQDYLTKLGALRGEGANIESGGYAPIQDAWEVVKSQIDSGMGWRQLDTSLSAMERVFNYRLAAIPGIKTMGPGAANPYMPGNGGDAGAVGDPAGGTGGSSPAASGGWTAVPVQ